MLRLIDCWDLTPSHADAKVRTKYTNDELLRGAEKRFDYPLSILSIKKSAKGLVQESGGYKQVAQMISHLSLKCFV